MPTLKAALDSVITYAYEDPGQVKQIALSRGLFIDVLYITGHTFRLLIWREWTYPSLAEWNTVLNHWPYELVAHPDPVEQSAEYIRGLTGVITHHKPVQLPLL